MAGCFDRALTEGVDNVPAAINPRFWAGPGLPSRSLLPISKKWNLSGEAYFQKLANGYFANGHFENPWKVPRRPPVIERKVGKRQDPSGKNMRPLMHNLAD